MVPCEWKVLTNVPLKQDNGEGTGFMTTQSPHHANRLFHFNLPSSSNSYLCSITVLMEDLRVSYFIHSLVLLWDVYSLSFFFKKKRSTALQKQYKIHSIKQNQTTTEYTFLSIYSLNMDKYHKVISVSSLVHPCSSILYKQTWVILSREHHKSCPKPSTLKDQFWLSVIRFESKELFLQPGMTSYDTSTN